MGLKKTKRNKSRWELAKTARKGDHNVADNQVANWVATLRWLSPKKLSKRSDYVRSGEGS